MLGHVALPRWHRAAVGFDPVRHAATCAYPSWLALCRPSVFREIGRAIALSLAGAAARLAIHHASTPQEYRDAAVVAREGMQGLEALVRRSRAVATMTKDEIDQVTSGRMGTEHDHLDALLDDALLDNE
jgi:hypothetical protein